MKEQSPLRGDRERILQPTVVRFIALRQVPNGVGMPLPIQPDAGSVAHVADAASVGTITERESAT